MSLESELIAIFTGDEIDAEEAAEQIAAAIVANVGGGGFDPPVHGRINGTTGAVTFGKGISSVTHIGAGHYQVDLDDEIPENEMVTIVMPEASTPRHFGVSYVDDDSIEIRAWDKDGVAADMNFRITVFQATLP